MKYSILLLFLIPLNSFATFYIPSTSVSINIACEAPSQFTDNSPIKPEDIVRYYFYRTTDPSIVGLEIGQAGSCKLTSESAVVGLADGLYYICATTEAIFNGVPTMSDRGCVDFIKGPLPKPKPVIINLIEDNL